MTSTAKPVVIKSIFTLTSFGAMHSLAAYPLTPTIETPVILVPGLGMSHRYMRPTLEVLAHDFTTYAVDFPGFGRSENPARTLDIKESSQALKAWMEAREIPRATFLANSFGCQILTQFAVDNPTRVEKLVLIAPTIDAEHRKFWRQFFRLLLDGMREPFPMLLLALREYLFNGSFFRGLRTLFYALADDIETRLPHIAHPTLIIRGERDPSVPRQWCEKLTALMPHARFVEIPRAAHAVNYNSPHELVQRISPYLRASTSSVL